MYYFAVGFGVLAHVFFWGAGLAVIATPAPWRRFWPLFAWSAGLALQSVVVWIGAYAGLAGTDTYAVWSEIIPLACLAIAIRRRGAILARDLGRLTGIWVLLAVNLGFLLLPLARITRALTTVSLGSMDAADYAAGARVFKEFAHGDRTGFLGLTEVVRVASVDNVYDFWLRLNHFTPSALVALNGTIFNCQPHELIGVLTAVLLTCSLPMVFWMSRAALGQGGGMSFGVAALYGFSPVTLYAVYHVAMGQLLAAPAVALLTWCGVALWRGRLSPRRSTAFAGVLAIGYALILGSYNFILLVCLAPGVAFAGGLALRHRQWRRFGGWWMAMLIPLVGCGAVFWARVAGLDERFRLFRVFDFGWRVPLLTPEGWLGLVSDQQLNAIPGKVRWALATIFAMAIIASVVATARRRPRTAYLVVCVLLTPLVGYTYLQLRGIRLGTNASYDAYKILAVFFPGVLGAVLSWAPWGMRRGRVAGGAVVLGLAIIGVGTVHTMFRFAGALQTPPLGVSRELIQLRRLEQDPTIGSLNLLTTDGWSRLWANAQLLRLPQYFETHTYEGRLNTPLRGRWDLIGGVIQIALPSDGSRKLGGNYSLVDTASVDFFRVRFGPGWHELEQPFGLPLQWRWTQAVAELRLQNPQRRELRADLRLSVRALEPQPLELWLDGERRELVNVGTKEQVVLIKNFKIPVGSSRLEFRAAGGTAKAGGDTRPLAIAFSKIEFDVLDAAGVAGH